AHRLLNGHCAWSGAAALAFLRRTRWTRAPEVPQRHIQALNRQLREANRQLAELAETDPLTGLANRRIFDARLAEEWNRAQRDCRPLSLILIDVDFFKRYNDHYGHPAGDSCLMEVAGAVKASARRAGDLAARIGGEEFALLLPRTTVKSAEMIAERLRRSVLELDIEHADTPGGRVSISLGVASTSPHCSTVVTRGHLVKTADVALYAAKSQGRIQVNVHALKRPAQRFGAYTPRGSTASQSGIARSRITASTPGIYTASWCSI